ncbi:MAG: HPr kinase/phosphorylase [Planktomarina sp.]
MADFLENLGPDPNRFLIHGTAVAGWGSGILIVGASGSGKSALALSLMAFGADLIADDRVFVSTNDGLELQRPNQIKDQIEARGLGVLKANSIHKHALNLILELSQTAEDRLPQAKTHHLLGQSVAHLKINAGRANPAAIVQWMKCGFHNQD